MRRILLTSAAVTALLAGPTLALAQGSPEPRQSPGASSQQSTQSPKGDHEKGQKASQSGQREHRDMTGSSTSGQMPKSKDDSKAAGSDRQEKRGAQNDQGKKSDQGKSQENRSNAAQKSGTSDEAQKSGASDNERSKGTQTTQPSDKKGQPKQSSSGQKNERSTTGQSPPDQATKGDRMNRDNANQQGQNRNEQGRTQQVQSGTEQGQGRTGPSSTTTGRSERNSTSQTQESASQESRSSTSVKPEVQSKFSETIEKRNIKTTTNVNVDVSVGRTIPRSVTVYDVPTDIVRINPEFRGKKFTVVRDEIVIIEPSTHKVVSVIPRSGGRATSGTSTSTGTSTSVRQSSRVDLPPEKRRIIRETVLKEQSAPRCQDIQVSVGSQVSTSVQFTPFPELVTREVPAVQSYQYCIKGNDIVLVDPSEHRVVEVIE